MKKSLLLCALIFILFLTTATAAAQVTFTDVTDAVGLGHFGANDVLPATWGDYDNDGDADLLTVGRSKSGGLYRNEGDRGFMYVTKAVWITGSGAATFVDFDNDGDLDLFVGGSLSGGDSMYRNENGTFLDISQPAGMDSRGRWSNLL